MSDIGDGIAQAMGYALAIGAVVIVIVIGAAFGLGWWLHG